MAIGLRRNSMRALALFIGCLAVSMAMFAGGLDGGIRGHLSITRVLTKQRVVLPTYPDRGVTAHNNLGKGANATGTAVNEWSRVVVFLESDQAPKPTPVTASVSQTGERFDPDLVIVPAGSSVSFPNFDPVFHNVFSLSKVREFDLGYYPAGATRTVKFDKPGVVQVYCHLHPEMYASILVVPNSWYLRPGNQGDFEFSAIPSGSYQVVVWHKSAGFFRKKIQVTPGSATSLSMEIPVGANEPQP